MKSAERRNPFCFPKTKRGKNPAENKEFGNHRPMWGGVFWDTSHTSPAPPSTRNLLSSREAHRNHSKIHINIYFVCFGPSEMFQEYSWMSIRNEHQSFKLSNHPKLRAAFIPWLVHNACNDGIWGSDSVSGALCGLYIHFVLLRNTLQTCVNGAMLTMLTAPLALTLAWRLLWMLDQPSKTGLYSIWGPWSVSSGYRWPLQLHTTCHMPLGIPLTPSSHSLWILWIIFHLSPTPLAGLFNKET